jgi:hypothetical protein
MESARQISGARIGLTQNIGGLANNNLVTILERTDRYRPIPVYWKPDYDPGNIKPKEISQEVLTADSGTLETYTTLYTTPEGIPSPLTIGFVKIPDGRLIMARARQEDLKIGQAVKVDQEGDLFYMRPSPPPEKNADGARNWLLRALSPADRKEDNR